jgi:hypothetical protein
MFDLTGGNDSRLTAAAMLHEYPEGLRRNLIWCVAGPEDHPDVQIANKIAEICKWPILRLSKDSATAASVDRLQKSIIQADGTCLVDAAFGRINQEMNRGPDWMWHVGSIGGELLRGFFWRHEFLSLGRTEKVDFGALLAYRLYASRQVDAKILGQLSPSLNEHDEILLAPYRRIGEIGKDVLNTYKLDAMYLHKLCYSAGSTQSWLMGVRNIQFPLLSWEVSRKMLSIPWKWRASRRLVLELINGMAPGLTDIPNDKGEPMKPLMVKTYPSYLKSGFVTGARTLQRVMHRYTNVMGARKQAEVYHLPPSWLPLVNEGRCFDAIFEPLAVRKLCVEAESGSCSSSTARALETVVTIELLLRSVPNLSSRVAFNSGPEMLS